MTYQEIRKNEEVLAFLKRGNDNLGVLGYTEHSHVHCSMVAERAASILEAFGYSEHDIELAKIAGFMHDIGNAINRSHHAEHGAVIANTILRDTDMSIEDRLTVISAIGNHDESTGGAKDAISAALIIADKTDVRRNRVRPQDRRNFDIHDRVNYSVAESELIILEEKREIHLKLVIETQYSSVMDYFEIFLNRMILCRKAAETLGLKFRLIINDQLLL